MSFDPNATGSTSNGIFSLPFDPSNSELILLPVPWEVTTSYFGGTSLGPQSILQSSRQMDLCSPLLGDFFNYGIYMEPTSQPWLEKNRRYKEMAMGLRARMEEGKKLSDEENNLQSQINQASEDLNNWVFEHSKDLMSKGKWCGVIGGDHSTPFGFMKALKEKHHSYSILHVDAHMDLRQSYQGYNYSHASIMRNVMEQIAPGKLIQVGIRDYCPEEREYALEHSEIETYFGAEIDYKLHSGKTWKQLCDQIVDQLDTNIYISFDIDGLSPTLCPNTGTPVPGGLGFTQVQTLMYTIAHSGKRVVGFDLCEVSPGQNTLDCWDGNVGARVLYELCGALFCSHYDH